MHLRHHECAGGHWCNSKIVQKSGGAVADRRLGVVLATNSVLEVGFLTKTASFRVTF